MVMLNLVFLLNIILFLFFAILVVLKYMKYKSDLLLSAIFWFVIYYCAYFMLPVLLFKTVLERPDLFGTFEFSITTQVYVHIICLAESVVVLVIFYIYSPCHQTVLSIEKRNVIIQVLIKFCLVFFAITSIMGIFELVWIIRTKGYLHSFFLLDEVGEKHRIKYKYATLRYIAVICCFYKYIESKDYKEFFYLIPNLIFEILAGKRTTAFLYVLFTYLVLVKERRKTYLKIIIPIIVGLLISVLFARMSSILQEDVTVDVLLASSLAEFINTFLTLPYVIENHMYGELDFVQILFNFFSPVLPGFMKADIMSRVNYQEIGNALALSIGKGYGFASNVITYNLYTFGFGGVLIIPISMFILLMCEMSLSKGTNFIINFFLIYQMRLFIRQGNESIIVLFYIFFAYCAIFYFFSENGDTYLLRYSSKRKKCNSQARKK